MTAAAGAPHTPDGIHHVTCIATDPQRNVDFYATVLGLRLVKTTVNFDAPGVYHLYFGDERGTPGSLITFFPWPDARPGVRGAGQATTTSFSVPADSLGWWETRLAGLGVDVERTGDRFDSAALALTDPDGLRLELVAHEGDTRSGWDAATVGVPAGHAVRGLHGVTLTERADDPTAALLVDTLGFRLAEQRGPLSRFVLGDGGPGRVVDLLAEPGAAPNTVAAGTVHHVAWRAVDEQDEEVWRSVLQDEGLTVTPILDRRYFRSIYFREPGGVLFELATDQPGFDVDEPLLELGRALKLPPWLEPDREHIEHALPALRRP